MAIAPVAELPRRIERLIALSNDLAGLPRPETAKQAMTRAMVEGAQTVMARGEQLTLAKLAEAAHVAESSVHRHFQRMADVERLAYEEGWRTVNRWIAAGAWAPEEHSPRAFISGDCQQVFDAVRAYGDTALCAFNFWDENGRNKLKSGKTWQSPAQTTFHDRFNFTVGLLVEDVKPSLGELSGGLASRLARYMVTASRRQHEPGVTRQGILDGVTVMLDAFFADPRSVVGPINHEISQL